MVHVLLRLHSQIADLAVTLSSTQNMIDDFKNRHLVYCCHVRDHIAKVEHQLFLLKCVMCKIIVVTFVHSDIICGIQEAQDLQDLKDPEVRSVNLASLDSEVCLVPMVTGAVSGHRVKEVTMVSRAR